MTEDATEHRGHEVCKREQRKNRCPETEAACLHYIKTSLPPGRPDCCVFLVIKLHSARPTHDTVGVFILSPRLWFLATAFNMCLSYCLKTGLHEILWKITPAIWSCHFLAV